MVTTLDPLTGDERFAEMADNGLFWTDDSAAATLWPEAGDGLSEVRAQCDPTLILTAAKVVR